MEMARDLSVYLSEQRRAMVAFVERLALAESPTSCPERQEKVLAILNNYGSVERANESAAQYAAAARYALRSFPDSEIKRALLWIPEFVLERQS